MTVRPNDELKYFQGKKTGTRIEIAGLRRKQWTRGDLRKLYRLVSSLASPFHTPDQFQSPYGVPNLRLSSFLTTDHAGCFGNLRHGITSARMG